MCDHCGTVTRALTAWTKTQIGDCPCRCHIAKEFDRTKPARKKGTKK